MSQTVIGVYDDYTQAQRALNELNTNGFSIERVKLSPQEQSDDARAGALRGEQHEHHEGGIVGFFKHLFGADDSGKDDARHGDVYSEAVRRGSYILTVHTDTDEETDRAAEILNRFDPVDIDQRAEQWRASGWTAYDFNSSPYSADQIQDERSRYASNSAFNTGGSDGAVDRDFAANPALNTRDRDFAQDRQAAAYRDANTGGTAEGETRIPVIQEELQVGKREVQRGGVRVFQHVTEQPVHEQVRLREEHVDVQRRPVNEPADEADIAALRDASFEVRETAEEAVVSKQARVVEEVVVNKEVSERTQQIDDTVRRTEVDVEKLGREGAMAAARDNTLMDDDSDFRNHWQGKYGTLTGSRYEDYAPAYRFGSEMGRDQRYSQYRWNDAEPDIRTNWESQHGGSHPWERVKDAVRYGWDKVTK